MVMAKRAKYHQIENVLGECFGIHLLEKMEHDWNAFYNDPEKYRGTVVVEMVNQWIDEQPPLPKTPFDFEQFRDALN